MSTKTDLRLPEYYRSLDFPRTRETWSDLAHILNIPSTERLRLIGSAASRAANTNHPPAFEASLKRERSKVAVRFKSWDVGAAGAWAALQLYRDIKGPERGLTSVTLEDHDPEMAARTKVGAERYYNLLGNVTLEESSQGVTPVRATADPEASLPDLLGNIQRAYDELDRGNDHSYAVSRAVGAVSLRRFCDAWESAYATHAVAECSPAEAARAFLYNTGVFEAQPW